MKQERCYGLDLLRILSMMGIIGLHMINQGGFLTAANEKTEIIIVRLAAALFYCSVNVFAMLTGYLQVRRENVRSASLLKLLLTAFVYCAGAVAVAMRVKPKLFTYFPELMAQALFPPLAGRYWYLTCYVLLFVMIPYLNTMVRHLRERQMRVMLLMLLALLSVATTFGQADYFRINTGYSPFWLMFCYLVGAYIRLHLEHLSGKAAAKWLWLAGANLALTVFLWEHWGTDVIKSKYLILEYTSPIMVVNAAIFVLVFARVDVRGTWLQKLTLLLSSSAFGVYLLHSHILVYDFWLKNAFVTAGKGGAAEYLGTLLAGLAGIYLACTLVDRIRALLFRLLRVDALMEKLGSGVDSLLGWRGKYDSDAKDAV